MLEVVVELGVAFAPEEDAEFEAPPLLPRFEPPPLPRPPRFPRVDRIAATSADSGSGSDRFNREVNPA